jgi:hypothetical protein
MALKVTFCGKMLEMKMMRIIAKKILVRRKVRMSKNLPESAVNSL